MNRDRVRLLHIRDAIARIRSFVSTREQFTAQRVIQDAVIRNLEVIGEAAKAISDETRTKRSEVPWTDIAAMRDRLIHGYFSVDLDLVWDVIATRLTPLLSAVESLLDTDGDDSPHR